MDVPQGDNNGRGWRRLSYSELAHLIAVALALVPRGIRRDYGERNILKSDAAKKSIAGRLADYLKCYPMFGPDRPAEGPAAGSRPPKSN